MMIGARRPNPFDMGTEPMRLDVPQFEMPQAAPVAAPAPKKGNVWLGVLADALSGFMGKPGEYAAHNYEQRAEQSAFERGEQRYQRQRIDGMADYRAKKDIGAQYPNERGPRYFEANNGDQYAIGEDGQPKLVFADPTPKERWVFDPVRGYVNINAMPAPAASSGPRRFDTLPQGAIPVGGAGSQAPRGFR